MIYVVHITATKETQTIFEQWNKLGESLCNYTYTASNHLTIQCKGEKTPKKYQGSQLKTWPEGITSTKHPLKSNLLQRGGQGQSSSLPGQAEVAQMFGLLSKATAKKGKGKESKQWPR